MKVVALWRDATGHSLPCSQHPLHPLPAHPLSIPASRGLSTPGGARPRWLSAEGLLTQVWWHSRFQIRLLPLLQSRPPRPVPLTSSSPLQGARWSPTPPFRRPFGFPHWEHFIPFGLGPPIPPPAPGPRAVAPLGRDGKGREGKAHTSRPSQRALILAAPLLGTKD